VKVLIIDNFDSFTYNLVHYVEEFAQDLIVLRNNEIEINKLPDFDKLIISPGPGLPHQTPILGEIINFFCRKKPILGVCLGLQAIVETLGGKLYNLKQIRHGVPLNTRLLKSDDYLFRTLPLEFPSGRYHSWATEPDLNVFDITAADDFGVVMAVSHKKFDVKGVQFHPESIMTPCGKQIIKNWIHS